MTNNFNEDLCTLCNRETDTMEWCCNAGCDNYLCSMCYIKINSGDIICPDCSDNCLGCSQIINTIDIEYNTECNSCYNEVIYCENCTIRYHLYSCNLGVCHSCVEKCSGCKEVVCCDKKFHKTDLCEKCVLFQLKESRDFMMINLISNIFCKDVCKIVGCYFSN